MHLPARIVLILLCWLICINAFSQSNPPNSCGQKAVTEKLYRDHPELKVKALQTEALLAKHNRQKASGMQRELQTAGIVTLPVVVHIIHNNGAENISDARVMQGIQHLNEAFARSGNYVGKGVNTQIQFCMAERDPAGKATNGITRNVSPYTTMGGSDYYSDDLHVKDINRWSTGCYLNIWLVNSIPGDVVGYAYLPSAVGTNVDGIIMEAAYFGSSSSNDVVITHEVGHYLGLYHTFEGACTNKDCITDGDQVCDTPPDQSTASVSCNNDMNTCTTDALSGFSSDQNDLKEDFLDYGNFDCMNVFTAGQSDRMNWFIQNVRYGLLKCKSCLPPCNSPVTALFAASSHSIKVGASVSFTNQSVNGNNYNWYVDGALKSSAKNYTGIFSTAGRHFVKLVVQSSNALCDDAIYTDTINVTCQVKADFKEPTAIIKVGQSVSFSNASSNASSYTWKINDIIKSAATDFIYNFSSPGVYAVTLVAAGTLCADSITKMISVYDSSGAIPPGLCGQNTFQKKYISNSKVIYDLRPLKDGGYIMGGACYTPDDGYGGSYAAKMDKGGSLVWAKKLLPFSWSQLQRIKETADGNYIGVGIYYEIIGNQLITKTMLLKLNASGDLLWAQKFGITGSPGEKGLDVTETNDGGYALCGSTNDDSWSGTNWLVCKTDGNGNITWSKAFDNNHYERSYGLIADGDDLLVTGIRTIPTGPRSEIVLTKLKSANGDVIQSKVFDVASRSVETTSIFKIAGGYMVGAHSIADGFYYADMDIVVLRLDEQLNLVRAGRIAADIFASVHGGFVPTPDGGFIAFQDGPNASITKDQTQVMMYKIDPQWQLEWAKQYPIAITEGQDDFVVNGVWPTQDKGYIFGETYVNNINGGTGEYLRIVKTDDKGNTPGCVVDTFRADFVTPEVAENEFSWAKVTDIHFNDPANPLQQVVVTDVMETAIQRCETSKCNYIKIDGKDSVCDISDTLTYTAKRNSECTAHVLWDLDTTAAKIISNTDSTIKVLFKKGGNVKLYARIVTACLILQDSMDIFVSEGHKGIYLGDDIQLCKQSTVRLSAGKGFRLYRWNDGSVDSTLTAYNPGTYYVTAIDYCGNEYSDAINIVQAPDVPLNLGPDLPRCDNDSVTITAPDNFENYIWTPNYHINSTSGSSVKVWPDVDTTYFVVVQKSFSCIVFDSIRIKVQKSIPINIGNDTSFCFGGAVTMRAPAGFAKYEWQDGSGDKTFTTSTKGTYWLHALNNNGCVSKDTMEVIDVYALPPLFLGADGAICINASNTLSAGAGYNSYLWNDGSTKPTLKIDQPGRYWITVTNDHCSNADTINITGFNPQPQGFLDPAMEICENAVTQITPKGAWQSYLWSDNTTLPYLITSAPGLYWLEVTNSFGCTGRDTIHILLKQDCPQVIYFPKAFSPNNDARNDMYKPTAMAPLEKFRFYIYNRWGQKVFETNDILKGWDGRYRQGEIPAGSFIWYCRYKFYGETERSEKGSLTLVR